MHLLPISGKPIHSCHSASDLAFKQDSDLPYLSRCRHGWCKHLGHCHELSFTYRSYILHLSSKLKEMFDPYLLMPMLSFYSGLAFKRDAQLKNCCQCRPYQYLTRCRHIHILCHCHELTFTYCNAFVAKSQGIPWFSSFDANIVIL